MIFHLPMAKVAEYGISGALSTVVMHQNAATILENSRDFSKIQKQRDWDKAKNGKAQALLMYPSLIPCTI